MSSRNVWDDRPEPPKPPERQVDPKWAHLEVPTPRNLLLTLWLYLNLLLGIVAVVALFSSATSSEQRGLLTILLQPPLAIGFVLMVAFVAGNFMTIRWQRRGVNLLVGSAIALLLWRVIFDAGFDITDVIRTGITLAMYYFFIKPQLEYYK